MRHCLLIALALLLAACSQNTVPPMYASLARKDVAVDAEAARDLINQHRALAGLAPLALEPALMEAAAAHARDMASHGRVGHNISNGTMAKRLTGRAIGYKTAAENVGAGYHTIADAISGWRGSPPHNANMLLAKASRMGIAAAYAPNSKYKVFWTFIVTGGE